MAVDKLPPAEKLPLAARKNIRDEWENKKEDLNAKINEILGTEWTLEVNVNQLFVYGEQGSYARDNLGNCIYEYFDSAIRRINDYVGSAGEDLAREINAICHAHVLTLDIDTEGRWSYNGSDVHEGKLRLLSEPTNLGTNIYDCLERNVFEHALNDADPDVDGTGLSFLVRQAKRTEYDPKVEEVRRQIAEALNKPDIKLTPNLEATYATLKEEAAQKGTSLDKRYWESQIPEWTLRYFEGFLSQLKWQQFDSDDMLQEGFNEAVDKGEIAFRVVEKLKERSYCEFEIEDGVFYLQCTPKTWGTNLSDAAEKIVDKL